MIHYIRELRQSTGLSQKEFANKYNIPLSTLRKWEQGDSVPATYLVQLIENSLPCYKHDYIEYIGEDKKRYYLDKNNKKIGDSLGNWIPFHEDIEGVIESNIPFYIEKAFTQYYQLIKSIDDNLKFDKIDKIKWR